MEEYVVEYGTIFYTWAMEECQRAVELYNRVNYILYQAYILHDFSTIRLYSRVLGDNKLVSPHELYRLMLEEHESVVLEMSLEDEAIKIIASCIKRYDEYFCKLKENPSDSIELPKDIEEGILYFDGYDKSYLEYTLEFPLCLDGCDEIIIRQDDSDIIIEME